MKDNLKSFGSSNAELSKELNIDHIENLDYLKMCFYESLRIEPPVPISSSVCVSETQKIDEFILRAGDMMLLNIY